MSLQRLVNERLFGIAPREALFARRGFRPAERTKQARLETIGATFIGGYMEALRTAGNAELAGRLDDVPAELRGFAYEGAAMGLAIADHAWLRRQPRLASFLEHEGVRHRYMLHVGYGWAVARLPWLRGRVNRDTFGLLHSLVVDGYGFHEGYFHWKETIEGRERPRVLRGYARRAFDQGLGRSLWFFNGADVERTASSIMRFDPDRHGDLWSGVGLAVAYAGGATLDEARWLYDRAGVHRPHVGQGAAFAAQARHLAGNPAAHTDAAARAFCGAGAAEAAHLTDVALEAARRAAHGGAALYEAWREALRRRMDRGPAGAGSTVEPIDSAREARA